MVTDKCYFIYVIIISSLLTSCNRVEDNIFGVRAKCSALPESIELDATTLDLKGPEIVRISDVQIYDTLIVLKGYALSSQCAVHVFSLEGKEYYGSYIERGRGHNEMLFPQLRGFTKNHNNEILVNVFDMNLKQVGAWNLSTSLLNKKTEFANSFKTEGLALNFIQTYSNYISLREKGNELYCSLICRDSISLVKDIKPLYPGVSITDYMDKLSSAVIFDDSTRQLVMAMMMLPQVNFLNVSTGEKKTVAISNNFRKWKQNFEKDNDEQTIYYIDCTKVDNLYVGLYVNTTFENWSKGIYEPYLHCFDNRGNILFNLRIKQRLKSIAYDKLHNRLLGVDINDKLYCYSLNSLCR